jgi:hypothetical protein
VSGGVVVPAIPRKTPSMAALPAPAGAPAIDGVKSAST